MPFGSGVGAPPSRVQLIVAGATVSGIAAVAGWLLLGAGRTRPTRDRAARTSATVALAPAKDLDLDVLVNRSDAGRNERYAESAPSAVANLWHDEDARPRWIRRLNDQVPPRPPSRYADLAPDEEPMPWLEALTWPVRDEGEDEIAR